MKKTFFSLVFLTVLSLMPFAAYAETTFERVVRTNTIRCGYSVWYPELIKDANTGALSGYDYDVMNAVGDILNMKVEWVEEVGWGAAQDGLATNRYDVVCNGVWGPPARTKVVLRSLPFVHHPMFVVLSAKTPVADKGTAWLNDPKYKIAVLRGTMGDIVAKMDFPKAQILDSAELSNDGNIMADLAAGKADFSFSNATSIERYLKDNPGGVKMLEPSFGMASGAFLLPGEDFRLKHMIDTALQYLIDSGGTEPIMEKYMGRDAKAWLPPAKSYEAAQ